MKATAPEKWGQRWDHRAGTPKKDFSYGNCGTLPALQFVLQEGSSVGELIGAVHLWDPKTGTGSREKTRK